MNLFLFLTKMLTIIQYSLSISRVGVRTFSHSNDISSNENLARKTEREKPSLSLDDIYISVKTTKKYHNKRIKVLLDTWIKDAMNQTTLFTDKRDDDLANKFGRNRIITTNCSQSHNYIDLCCKTNYEIKAYFQHLSTRKWFCHVDDDTFLNVRNLVDLLRRHDPDKDWYLGKRSINSIHLKGAANKGEYKESRSFSFGTFGAGVCLSKKTVQNLKSYFNNVKTLNEVCSEFRVPDDIALGFILEVALKIKLKEVKQLHSHLENLSKLNYEALPSQITLSYNVERGNTVSLPSSHKDKTKFFSLYKHIHKEENKDSQ